jgi:hypothetical protein
VAVERIRHRFQVGTTDKLSAEARLWSAIPSLERRVRRDGLIGFNLQLKSPVNDVSDLPTEDKNLILVAEIHGVIHFRIFAPDGQLVVDINEDRLPDQAQQIAELRSLLGDKWGASELSQSDNNSIITAVTSIVGYSPLSLPQDLEELVVLLIRAAHRRWKRAQRRQDREGEELPELKDASPRPEHEVIEKDLIEHVNAIIDKVMDDEVTAMDPQKLVTFEAWLEDPSRPTREFADLAGVNQPTVRRWISDFQRLTVIKAWLEDPSRPTREFADLVGVNQSTAWRWIRDFPIPIRSRLDELERG